MKNWKFYLMAGLCSLFVATTATSCSDDDDDKTNLGNTDINDIPTGKVALDNYGMRAFFPKEGWGKFVWNKFQNMTGASAEFSRDCVATYLQEDSISFAGQTSYQTVIYFNRFQSAFYSEAEADNLIADYHYIMDGMCDVDGNDPNLEYEKVSEIQFAQVGNKYNGSLIETLDKFGYYQANYFVYSAEKDSLYMVTLSINNEEVETNSAKYQDCMNIISTLKIK